MADAKALTDIATSYTTLAGGDLFGVERSGTVGKFTWNSFQAQDMTLTGTINFGSATVSGLTASAFADGDYGDISVASGVMSVDADTIGPTELQDTAVIAGSYTNASITVDAQGRITAASSNNSAGSEVVVDFQEFTASGTWTKPGSAASGDVVKVQVVGGGGGGGATNSSNNASGGGGGGGAIYFVENVDNLSATETVTVGSGGAGHAGTNGDGSAGGDSSFGTSGSYQYCIARGGGAGRLLNSSSGGTCSRYNASGNMPGEAQGGGSNISTVQGVGSSFGGGGGAAVAGDSGFTPVVGGSLYAGSGGISGANTSGGAGQFPGGGGGAGEDAAGGAGADGVVRVWVIRRS